MLRKALRKVPTHDKHIVPVATVILYLDVRSLRAETLPYQLMFIKYLPSLMFDIWIPISAYITHVTHG